MHTLLNPIIPNTLRTRRSSADVRSMMQSLERRTLLSGWATVDDFVPPPQGSENYAIPDEMASDGAGGVFAVGETYDYSTPDGKGTAVVRYKNSTSSEWRTVATAPSPTSWTAGFTGVAVAPSGDVYISGWDGGGYYIGQSSTKIWKGTWDATHTALSLSVVDDQFTGSYSDITIDAAGNVFAAGNVAVHKGNNYTRHWVVRKQTAGQGAFVTVDDFLFNNSHTVSSDVTVIPSGTNAGVYVVGRAGGGDNGIFAGARWMVRKSTNGGSAWTVVDSFQLEPSKNAPAAAADVYAHEDGTLYVAGRASTTVRTGGTDKRPTYGFGHRWYVRSSGNGGTSWSSHDVYPESARVYDGTKMNFASLTAAAVVTDQTGNLYVAGEAGAHSIVRSNAGGSWQTSDDFQLVSGEYSKATCLARDSSGSIYVGGSAMDPSPIYSDEHWFVRSMTPVVTAAAATFSSASITDSSISDGDRIIEDIFGA
jgi:hypothetical protein